MTKKLFVPEAQYEEGEVIPAYLLEDVVQSAGESTSVSDVRPKPMYDTGYPYEDEVYGKDVLITGTDAVDTVKFSFDAGPEYDLEEEELVDPKYLK